MSNNGVIIDDLIISAFDSVGTTLVLASYAVAPSPSLPLVLAPIANIISAPYPPPESATTFCNAFSQDIMNLIGIPLTAGAAAIAALTPPPPAPYVIASSTTQIASLMVPQNPALVKAFLQWAVSLVPPGDLRVPGGFVVN
jgi:hypothetical protein